MATIHQQDLTIVYYTCNEIPQHFANITIGHLMAAAEDIPIISVSHRPMILGQNIVAKMERSQASIYKQALIGAKKAETKYIACCEDDVLYSSAHFKFRPKDGHWGYNMNSWNIYTWGEPIFSYKPPGGRRNLNGLICDRQMFIDHLEERFRLWEGKEIDIRIFGEPGKYDSQLGTTPYPSEYFYPNPPNIVFSHQTNLQYAGLGSRKKLGEVRALEIPYWGRAEDVRGFYDGV